MAHVIIKCRVTFGKKMFNDCIKRHSICMRLVLSTQEEFSLKRAHYGHSPLFAPAKHIQARTTPYGLGSGELIDRPCGLRARRNTYSVGNVALRRELKLAVHWLRVSAVIAEFNMRAEPVTVVTGPGANGEIMNRFCHKTKGVATKVRLEDGFRQPKIATTKF